MSVPRQAGCGWPVTGGAPSRCHRRLAAASRQKGYWQSKAVMEGKGFYGWWIAMVACLVNAFAWSTRAGFAVVYAAMLQDLGWSRTRAVLRYALSWLALVPFSPLAG